MIDKPGKDSHDIIVWKKSNQSVLLIHQYIEFSKKELAGLISQLRQLIVSTPKNIRAPFKTDRAQFSVITQGSTEECRYHLILATDINYGDNLALLMMMEEKTKGFKYPNKSAS